MVTISLVLLITAKSITEQNKYPNMFTRTAKARTTFKSIILKSPVSARCFISDGSRRRNNAHAPRPPSFLHNSYILLKQSAFKTKHRYLTGNGSTCFKVKKLDISPTQCYFGLHFVINIISKLTALCNKWQVERKRL
jgi:hypothetical protein